MRRYGVLLVVVSRSCSFSGGAAEVASALSRRPPLVSGLSAPAAEAETEAQAEKALLGARDRARRRPDTGVPDAASACWAGPERPTATASRASSSRTAAASSRPSRSAATTRTSSACASANRPLVAVRVFQTKLQWPMYGASAHRTQTQPSSASARRSASSGASRVGALIEFPAVVSDGVAYVSNFRGVVRAFSMRTGQAVWRRATPHGKMAASPAICRQRARRPRDGRPRLGARPLQRAACSGRTTRARRSSPRRSSSTASTTSAPGTGRVYALDLRTHRAALDVRLRVQDHLERRGRRSGTALHRRLRRPRCSRSRRANGRLRWSRLRRRPHLRDARGRGRARLRAVVDRRLADRLLDAAAAASGRSARAPTSTRRPRSGTDASSSAPTTASSTASRRASGGRSGVPDGGAICGAPSIVGRDRLLRQPPAPDLRARRAHRPPALPLPRRQFVPVSGNGGRLLLHGFSRLYAVEPRRR